MNPITIAFLTASLFLSPPGVSSSGHDGLVVVSTAAGSLVDGNQFANATQVFVGTALSGATHCSGPGMPDGEYYFQVTNTTGSVLASADPIENRRVLVVGGLIVGAHGSHTLGVGPCRSKSISVAPLAPAMGLVSEFKIWLTPQAAYDVTGAGVFGFDPARSRTEFFTIAGTKGGSTSSRITGHKFYDFNENGIWNPEIPEEVGIVGWRIEIYRDGLLEEVQFTGLDGLYRFRRPLDGATYVIREVAPGAGFIPNAGAIWLAITPTEGSVVADAEEVSGPNFGNVSFEKAIGLGRSKGFWHSKNGKPLLEVDDPDWRISLNEPYGTPLCLRRNDGSVFTVPLNISFADAFAQLKEYLVAPALGEIGNILSVQVAATVLNHGSGYLQGTIYIDAHGDGVLVSIDSLIEGVKMLLCDPGANDTGPDSPNQMLKDKMLECLNEFQSINATGTVSNPQIAYRISNTASEFTSPYETVAKQ